MFTLQWYSICCCCVIHKEPRQVPPYLLKAEEVLGLSWKQRGDTASSLYVRWNLAKQKHPRKFRTKNIYDNIAFRVLRCIFGLWCEFEYKTTVSTFRSVSMVFWDAKKVRMMPFMARLSTYTRVMVLTGFTYLWATSHYAVGCEWKIASTGRKVLLV